MQDDSPTQPSTAGSSPSDPESRRTVPRRIVSRPGRDWRQTGRPPTESASGLWKQRILITALALTAIGMVGVIAFAPLTSWQTTCVSLALDDYPLGLLAPVPYGEQDIEALRNVVAGRCGSVGERNLVELTNFATSSSIRGQLANHMQDLPLRHKDVLVAYVRGQTLVTTWSGNQKDSSASSTPDGTCCLAASDFSAAGIRPTGLVDCRQLLEALGAGKNRTTLVAMDLGDLRWDPRLGVVLSLVPSRLGEELRGELAPGTQTGTGENWLITSHDAFEFSSAHAGEHRSLFSKALELALGGVADDSPWGDSNGVVELDELARFVLASTSMWAQATTGGRYGQHPVVWKVGVGRVPLEEIPTGIELIRVPARSWKERTGWLGRWFTSGESKPVSDEFDSAADNDAAAEPTQTPQNTEIGESSQQANADQLPDSREPTNSQESAGAEKSVSKTPSGPPLQPVSAADESTTPDSSGSEPRETAPKEDKPTADTTTPVPSKKDSPKKQSDDPKKRPSVATKAPAVLSKNPWELLEIQNRRPKKPGDVVALSDLSPHLVSMASHQIASAECAKLTQGKRGARGDVFLRDFMVAMQQFDHEDSTAKQNIARSQVATALRTARDAGVSAKAGDAWQELPAEVRSLLAARNDAVELVSAVNDLNGKLSAGLYPSLIHRNIVDTCISQIAEATTILSDFTTKGNTEPQQLDRIVSTTQLLLHKLTGLREFVSSASSTIAGSTNNPSSQDCHTLFQVLASTAVSPQDRERLIDLLRFDQTDSPQLLAPSAVMLAATRDLPRQRPISRTIARQISLLATAEIDLFVASIGHEQTSPQTTLLQPILDGIQRAQTAVRELTLAIDSPNQPTLEKPVSQVAETLSQLFVRARTAATSAEFTGDSNLIISDQYAGVLRVLDPRDAPVAAIATVVTPLNLRRQVKPLIELEIVQSSGIPPGSKLIAMTYQGDDAALRQGDVVFQFDPALAKVSQRDGTPLSNRTAIPVAKLAWRQNRTEFLVTAAASLNLNKRPEGLPIAVTIRNAGQSSRNSITIPLIRRSNLLLAVKGHPLTVTGPLDEAGWSHTEMRGGKVTSGAGRALDATAIPTVTIRSWPAGLTQWEVGLENLSGVPRSVSVSVYQVPESTTFPDRSTGWEQTATAIRDGSATAKPLLVAEDVSLDTTTGIQSINLTVPKPTSKKPDQAPESTTPEDKKPPQKNSDDPLLLPAPSDDAPQEIPISADLAVVVREKSKEGPTHSQLFRISLKPIHPRQFVSATGQSNERRREIQIALDSSHLLSGALPPGGVTGKLYAINPPSRVSRAITTPPVVLPRKPVVTLSRERPIDVAVLAWNGNDRGTATLAVDVNDYPRAFIFSIDVSPATDGIEQSPQRDWRSIRITNPLAARTLLRAPTQSIPMSLQVDSPADAFRDGPDGGDLLEIVLRPIGVGTIASRGERVGWKGFSDRQVRYTLPSKPKGLEVETVVSDWKIDVSGEGFANLDVTADARLSVSGRQQSATDSRTIVFDGTPPVIDAPPTVSAVVGRESVIALRVSDDVSDGFFIPPDRVRPGVSGMKTVLWAIDLEGNGKPEKWTPAVWLGGVRYELRIDTKKLPAGIRLPVLVTATDRVGLADPPTRVWLDVAAEPASPNNVVTGRVVLDGRGESGVWVVLTGPGGERRVSSDKDGKFRFTNLEPGDYSVFAQGAVRNTSRTSEVAKVSLAAAPAAPASVTLQLK